MSYTRARKSCKNTSDRPRRRHSSFFSCMGGMSCSASNQLFRQKIVDETRQACLPPGMATSAIATTHQLRTPQRREAYHAHTAYVRRRTGAWGRRERSAGLRQGGLTWEALLLLQCGPVATKTFSAKNSATEGYARARRSSRFFRDDYSPWTALDVVRV